MLITYNCRIGIFIIAKKNNINNIKKNFEKKYKPYEIGFVSKGKKRLSIIKNIKW